MWKHEHEPLQSSEHGSLRRLENLTKKLQREPDVLTQYDQIIQDQLETGIVERVTSEPAGGEFYIPHKPVIRESAESAKLRIVFDASAKASESLIEQLLGNRSCSSEPLVRNRLKPIALAGDLKQAFLQVRIRMEDRDALRFHWLKNKVKSEVEVLRFTRALFGLVQSPFLLEGHYNNTWRAREKSTQKK